MALLSVQPTVPASGIAPTYSAANASDTFPCGNNLLLLVENSNASTRTITLTTPNSPRGLSQGDPSATIAATTGRLTFGPLDPTLYADPVTGVGTVTPSATAGVTYAVIQLTAS
jgi:hypothetical protein